LSTAIGWYFGQTGGFDAAVFGWCLLGTGLIASGTATLNQWYERDADALMRRTMARPLPAGLVKPGQALAFGMALLVAGEAALGLGVNGLTAGLGLFTVASYLLVYTPLKRRTWCSTAIGALPGAMPPLIGFAAARGALTIESWILFAILFLWQFPHFYAIAWMYREDYARAGIKMLPVVEPDGISTSRHVVAFSLALIPASLLPGFLGMAGHWYLAVALLAGALFLRSAVTLARRRELADARGVLKASVAYLPVLYALLLVDSHKLWR
jgi:protoheme IX farnesyltransferase